MPKGIFTSKHLISIYFSVPFFSHYFSATGTNVHVSLLSTYVFLLPLKTPHESYRFPSYSVDSVDSVDSVKPVFAMCKAALLKIRYLLSLSFFLYSSVSLFLSFLAVSLFLSYWSFLSPFFLSTLFRLSLLLDFYSLGSRSASNVPEKGNEDTGTQCALNRSLGNDRFRRSLSRH